MEAEEISSQATTKYEVATIAPYIELEKHTDLNLPPSNWLKDNLAGKFANKITKKRNVLDFSSLLMAGKYPEIIGEVDILSAADHIKKLLKMPYSNSPISMTVHCIGKSLLLNELDVPALLELSQGNPNLNWLHDLYCSASNLPQNTKFCRKKRNKEQSEISMIQSKFMYYSIEDGNSNELQTVDNQFIPLEEKKDTQVLGSITSAASTLSPGELNADTEMLCSNSYFLRDVLWKFEDLTMLVGSDLPIFGAGRYPAVSLRLRDSSKPISILTGIDYWLDNLMCNVPELIMCYHLKGIVQKYEQIKTKDLPHMEDSSFSPKVIKDVAQNILSFLKSNCTKEGHTYWLFKSNKDDVLKLYDLTSICHETSSGEDRHNPFSLSVAVLLYKIVRNMFCSGEINSKNVLKSRILLQHCSKLLENENRPVIGFLSNYLLTELDQQQTSADGDEETESTETSDDENLKCSTDDELSENEKSFDKPVNTVNVQDLVSTKLKLSPPDSPVSYVDEECKTKNHLSFAINALKCLTLLYTTEESSTKPSMNIKDEGFSNDLQLLPFQHDVLTRDLHLMNVIESIDDKVNSKLKMFSTLKDTLLERISRYYVILANISINRKKFGRALRFVQIACYCLCDIEQMQPKHSELSIKALMFYGDILIMVINTKNEIKSELDDFHTGNEYDLQLYDLISRDGEKDIHGFHLSKFADNFLKEREDKLRMALKLYEQTILLTGNDNMFQVIELTRRLGNVRNELGVSFMNQAASLAKQYGPPSAQELQIWKQSYHYFETSIQAFQVVNDRVNQVLLYANFGRLMCLCAQVYGYSTRSSIEEERGQFTQQEKTYFHKAFEYYHKALSTLQGKRSSLEIWLNINMELSGSYYMMATVMQDYAPLNSMAEEQVVKEVTSSLMKALQYSEPIQSDGTPDQKNFIVHRLAMIHQRLASLYHHMLKNQISDHGKKNYYSLAELHYRKVYSILQADQHPQEILQVIVLHADLCSYASKQSSSGKVLKTKLDFLLSLSTEPAKNLFKVLQKVVAYPVTSFSGKHASSQNIFDVNELDKILTVLESQLKNTLKDTVKLLTHGKHNHIDSINLPLAKSLYEIVLRRLNSNQTDVRLKVKIFLEVLTELQCLYKQREDVKRKV